MGGKSKAGQIVARTEDAANRVRVPMTRDRLGFATLARSLVKQLGEDHAGAFAASLSFRGLLALFPFSILVLALLGAVGAGDSLGNVLDRFAAAMPREAVVLLREQIFAATEGGDESLLTIGAIFAAMLALWGVSGAMRSVMDALNMMYGVSESRPFVRRTAISLGLAIAVVVLVLTALTLVVAGPAIAREIALQTPLEQPFVLAWSILQWPALIALMLLAFALVYYIAPDVDQRFRFVSPGAVVGVALWLVFSLGFSLYANSFSSYNATYGTLAGVVVLMLYLYWSSYVLLIGAELNQIIEAANPAGKDEGERT